MTRQIQIKSEFEWILNLFDQIKKNPNGTNSLAKRIGMKPSKFAYWASKLEDSGWIEKSQSYPYAIYSITPIGEQIQKKLVQSENRDLKPYWRCHARIMGFKSEMSDEKWKYIKSRFKKVAKMTNWEFVHEIVKTDIGKFKIHIQQTGTFKIYCPVKYTDNKRETWAEIDQKAREIADKYCENWELDKKPLETIRKGEEELVGSEMIAKLFGKVKMDDVWVDKSTGTEWLEEKEGSDRIERLIDMPDSIQTIQNDLKAMKDRSRQLETFVGSVQEQNALISDNLVKFSKYLAQHIELMAKAERRIETTERENQIIRKRLEERGKQSTLMHHTL